ncbi:MAG: GTPase [Candidatus Pacearchaeota archaeon]
MKLRKKLGFKGTNIEPYWNLIKRIIHESDIVLEILDARLIDLSRNEEVEKIIQEKKRPFIFVVNKFDLVNKKDVIEKINELKKVAPVIYVSKNNRKSIHILLHTIKKIFKKYGKRYPAVKEKEESKKRFREAKADIVVGVLGYPNVGKSSIINSLCHKRKVTVSKKAGTTHGIHWIRLDDKIKLIDSPGVIPLKKEDEIRYGLIGAKDIETLKNPDLVADAIIKYAIQKNKKSFEKFYKIKIDDFMKCDIIDTRELILKIAKNRNFLLKGAIPDENRAISLIIRDWQQGRLRL